MGCDVGGCQGLPWEESDVVCHEEVCVCELIVDDVVILPTDRLLFLVRRAQKRVRMGGDHRCSVCQATFTRPQHVARHMRSREYLFRVIFLWSRLAYPTLVSL